MRSLLSRLLAAVLILTMAVVAPATSAVAEHADAPLLDLMDWSGCTADLVTSDEVGIESSYYDLLAHTLYIGTDPDRPAAVVLMVVLHEIGHCLQAQEGMLDLGLTIVEIELDADRRAADLACALHLDGAALLHDLFVWANESFGYEGDSTHGTMAERIAQGARAPACHRPPAQS